MKTKRYWLRGGLWAIGILFFVALCVAVYLPSHSGSFNFSVGAFLLLVIASPVILMFNGLGFQNVFSSSSAVYVDAVLCLYALFTAYLVFLLGILVGWIYGRRKNCNKIPQV